MDESLEPLLTAFNDPAVVRAAAGLRPVLDPHAPLPSSKVRFQLNDINYNVSTTGAGTLVYLYGTDEFGHTVAARASGFYPYLYVEIPQNLDVRQLVNEINATVLMSLAFDGKKTDQKKRKFVPEREAMIQGIVGKVKRVTATSARIERAKRDARSMPVVGYEIVPASIMRGTGGDYGYRGIEQRWMLKVYFYSPALLVRARSLLHGKNSHLPIEEQAKALCKARTLQDDSVVQKDATKLDKTQQTLDKWIKDPDAHMDTYGEEDQQARDADRAIFNSLPDNADELFGMIDKADDDVEVEDDNDYDLTVGNEWRNGDDPVEMEETNADATLSPLHYGADAHNVLQRKIETEFEDTARTYLRTVRSPFASILSRLTEEFPLKVCDADIEFILRFCVDSRITPCGWVEIDTKSAAISPDLHREDVRNNKAHSADGLHPGFPDSKWMLNRTPPGVEPRERYVRRVIPRRNYRDNLDTETLQQIELWTDFHNIVPVNDEKMQATVAQSIRNSFDIETETGPNNTFPNPDVQKILNIGNAIPLPVRLQSKKKWRNVVFCVGQVSKDVERSDVDEHVLCFPDERTQLMAYFYFLELLSADEFMTFNGHNFDFPYLKRRAEVLGILPQFERCWCKKKRTRLRITPRNFQSTAHGRHEANEVVAEGVAFIDIYQLVKRNPGIRLSSYSLDKLSEHFLGDHKEKVSPADINFLHETANGRMKLKRYVLKDSMLPHRLDMSQKWTLGLVEKARLTGCTLTMLMTRGMGIQGKSLMYRWNRQRGLFIPEAAKHIGVPDAGTYRLCVNYTRTDRDRRLETGTYEGAIVLDPMIGLYVMCVSTLDFNSLYPSCQVAENMDCATIVDRSYDLRKDRYLCYLVASGAYTWDTIVRRIADVNVKSAKYQEVIPSNATTFLNHGVLNGLLPDIQRFNLGNRKEVKNLMEKLGNDVADYKKQEQTPERLAAISEIQRSLEVYDQRQNGLKLVANSLYGLYGSPQSFLYSPLIAAAVTGTGRCRIYLARDIVHNILSITRDDKIVQDMMTFPGINSLLVKLPKGTEVVDTMFENIAAIRKATTDRPMEMRASGAARTTTVTAKRQMVALDAFFDTETVKRKPGADSKSRQQIIVDETSREASDLDADAQARVIYGDTDSVMIRYWTGLDPMVVAKFSAALADFISVHMHLRYGVKFDVNACIYRIEFEKMALAFLLVGKKKYAFIKRVLKKGKLEGDNTPSLSGMEAGKRDTTKFVARGQKACLAILLDQRYSMPENMRRATAYIYQEMIQPLLQNRADLYDLVQTKQLRNYIEAYTQNGQTAPVHVQLAAKLCVRAGGRNEAGAPRPGDRLPYIIAKGEEPLSERGEDPVYAFRNGVPVDANYYLNTHVAPVLQRIFQPLLTAHRTDILDDTERAAITREYLFGSRTGFAAPKSLNGRKYDFTEYRDKKDFPTVHTTIRYPKQVQHKRDSVLMSDVEVGAKCAGCNVFLKDRRSGAVCKQCMEKYRDKHEDRLMAAFSQLTLDEQHLSKERAAIVRKCQKCADCEHQYTSIKCEEYDCPVLWRRFENMQAIDECAKRKLDVIKSLGEEW